MLQPYIPILLLLVFVVINAAAIIGASTLLSSSLVAYSFARLRWPGKNLLFGMLLATEIYGLWALATLTWFSWSRPAVTRPEATPGRAVDVYVCTYDEPVEVVMATLAGCRALSYPHTTWLLDDGRRTEMEEIAELAGARYLTRPDNSHAKAGNLNAALRSTPVPCAASSGRARPPSR